jgi:hypothetical protein
MASHDRDGCRGEHGGPCSCTRDRIAALVASVSDAQRRAKSERCEVSGETLFMAAAGLRDIFKNSLEYDYEAA